VDKNIHRIDYRVIIEMIGDETKVLDLGCGDGELLEIITKEHSSVCQGIEIDADHISLCMKKGVSAIQGDLDEGLNDYPDKSFDHVILNQTLQVVISPDKVIEEMVRVGKSGIIGFPNFGHFSVRMRLLLNGRMPITKELPDPWYSTPNIHLMSIKDFEDFCEENNIIIEKRVLLSGSNILKSNVLYNLMATHAVFKIRKA
jgi:methionine biosynthesis protein MetW